MAPTYHTLLYVHHAGAGQCSGPFFLAGSGAAAVRQLGIFTVERALHIRQSRSPALCRLGAGRARGADRQGTSTRQRWSRVHGLPTTQRGVAGTLRQWGDRGGVIGKRQEWCHLSGQGAVLAGSHKLTMGWFCTFLNYSFCTRVADCMILIAHQILYNGAHVRGGSCRCGRQSHARGLRVSAGSVAPATRRPPRTDTRPPPPPP